MSSARTARPSRPLEARHLQIARALLAAIAAAMITFSGDHSAAYGLSVFSGFAISTALVLFLGAWLIRPVAQRGAIVLLAVPGVIAGMLAGISALRSVPMFFALVVSWAVVSGVIELVAGLRARRAAPASARSDARDAIVVGALGILLGIGVLLVPAGYALQYTIAEAHLTLTLTGITIAVGIFGGYAAIVAVFLGIAGFSPRKDAPDALAAPAAAEDRTGETA